MSKKILSLLFASVLILSACDEENADATEGMYDDNTEAEVLFNHGVNGDYEVLGDSQNYLNFTGKLGDQIDSNQVAVIDPESNIVLGISKVNDENEFYISTNMQGASDREVVFSYDESISIPTVDNINSLNSAFQLHYIKNSYLEANEHEPEEATEEVIEEDQENNTILGKIGDTVVFSSDVQVTLDAVELSDEEPNGPIDDNFVRVDFTIDNQFSEPLPFNGHSVQLYDGERNKAELNAKNFYTKTIAPGMKGSGSVYFDSKTEGPFTVVIGDATWETE